MSSFVGHGLAALAIAKGFTEKNQFKQRWIWLIFFVSCAWAPDVDYVVKSLDSVHNGGLRITHSIGFSLILPVLGILYLSIFDRKNAWSSGLPACLAGLSHLFLDALVGSRNADPLLYPLTAETFRLPIGILPSAGAIKLSNYYFYRNLLIECGILIPTFLLMLHFWSKLQLSKISLVLSITSLLVFFLWSVTLSR